MNRRIPSRRVPAAKRFARTGAALRAVGGGLLLLAAGCNRGAAAKTLAVAAPPAPVDFNREIRPILNANCVVCHGGVKMLGNISFVFREEATRAGKSGLRTIQPGNPDGSELIARITSKDLAKRMPPPDRGRALTPEQVAVFRQWIKEGANWSEHWAFVAPKPQAVPAVAAAAQAPTPVDRFIVARLEHEGLAPSPEADRATLLRRVSLDLTGLPPTAAELGAYLADRSPEAYERQVDRLLASPHFGERWAAPWLDLARYADTKGYEKDLGRTFWKYRDWVIDAFNRNLPYDRFLVDQLAGDLLPGAKLEDRIATAFHRNTQSNDEGGTSDEEFRMAAVLDRTNTTWLAFNGVTINCVQCHSHPYDPIRNKEYYSFLAFFNNTADANLYDEHPTLKVPDDDARYAEADRLEHELRETRLQLIDVGRTFAADPAQWRPVPIASASADPAVAFRLRDGEAFAEGTVATAAIYDLRVDGPPTGITALRVDVPPMDPVKARYTPEDGFLVTRVEAWLTTPDGAEQPIAIGRFFADSIDQPTTRMGPTDVAPARSKPVGPIPPGFYFAAVPALNQERWVIAMLASPLSVPAGSTLKVRLRHGVVLKSKPAPVRRVKLAVSTDPRWTAMAANPEFAQAERKEAGLTKQLAAIPGTRLGVMEDLPPGQGRETRAFVRGNFLDKDGPALTPDVPKLFPPLPAGAPRNRLTLAEWFVSPAQPLTARVAVNRFWEQLFGIGIVETLEDFGSIGEPPSHPELLDWLARRFQFDLHWDTKAMLRELVITATYRQSARVTPALLAKDPRNRLLARGPRNRLSAEMVRDQALVASGLLAPQLHGPPVMPPQPAGLWENVYNESTWVDATGPNRYRRAVYTYLKRSTMYPSLLTFDAPTRDVCTLRRIPTNTPLQSLVILNDPVYAEAGAALAARMRAEGGATLHDQIAFGFSLVSTRSPSESEAAPLLSLYDDSLKLYRADPGLLRASGAPDEVGAALAAVASALLNLDSALTK